MGLERSRRLLVLYGSQTGTAQDAADRVGREARLLPSEDVVIFVVSTTGQGDMPDSMKEFWKFLLQKNISDQWLEHVHYAVFGLGDSAYQKYNFAAKKLDRRLLNIGGKPLVQKGLGDDQHRSGYEGAFDLWLSSLWNALHEKDPMLLPRSIDNLDASTQCLDSPKFEVIFHSINEMVATGTSTLSDLNCAKNLIGKVRSMSLGKSHYKRPQYLLQSVTNQQLIKSDADTDVRHLEFESSSSDLRYQVGDVLEVLPAQDPDAVEAFIRRANLDPDCYITVRPKVICKHHDSSADMSTPPVKLRTFVELAMDVASASPRRYFFEVMSFFASAEHEKEKLQYFASPEGRDDLFQYNQKERRTVLEFRPKPWVYIFYLNPRAGAGGLPSVQLPFEWLVQLAPPLRTRAFSISSSPLAHPDQVHLTRKRSGLCSNWLAGVVPRKAAVIYLPGYRGSDSGVDSRGCLAAPPPSEPLILVGPGTGCAPFRGFVEERAAQKAEGRVAPILFFFGCRNQEKDFLYRDFWVGGGFFAAFSRDQVHKVYVQHKMKEERKRVWRLLSGGAAVYIAGSSAKMPADVVTALEEIVAEEAGLDSEAAGRWLRRQRAGGIFIEAWS
ncbi:unnamed protein product [Spirodela intermedia]|uniref:Uncharacterized protein n=1 Tax=Spirodela intermedia TaxID=51605 RepID=A0A7I8J5Y8_SPIIN|nr:unnamed protein product [Spirodela intermedia]CAA6664852.1 unnamed protein product [Spirodela intermedia]